MVFFKKNRKTQEQLNEEFSKLGEEDDTDVVDSTEEVKVSPVSKGNVNNYQKQVPKFVPKPTVSSEPKYSQKQADLKQDNEISEESTEEFNEDVKMAINEFNKDYASVVNPVPDKNFTLLFAIYSELRKNNEICMRLVDLMEEMKN